MPNAVARLGCAGGGGGGGGGRGLKNLSMGICDGAPLTARPSLTYYVFKYRCKFIFIFVIIIFFYTND